MSKLPVSVFKQIKKFNINQELLNQYNEVVSNIEDEMIQQIQKTWDEITSDLTPTIDMRDGERFDGVIFFGGYPFYGGEKPIYYWKNNKILFSKLGTQLQCSKVRVYDVFKEKFGLTINDVNMIIKSLSSPFGKLTSTFHDDRCFEQDWRIKYFKPL